MCVTIASLLLSGKSLYWYPQVEPFYVLVPDVANEDLHDQMTMLIGSAVRLLCGEAGVFVVSNEAFDPQSSEEYTVYRLSAALLAPLLAHAGAVHNPIPVPARQSCLPASLVAQLGLYEDEDDGELEMERCSLFVHDYAGMLGVLHTIRPVGVHSCFEKSVGARENGVGEATQDMQWSCVCLSLNWRLACVLR